MTDDAGPEVHAPNDRNENAEGKGRLRYGRRNFIVGITAAGAGLAAGLVVNADPAEAANGLPVLLGRTNTATATTTITTTAGDGLRARASQSNTVGVHGIDASPSGGHGVVGASTNNIGVEGTSTHGAGVYGISGGADGVSGVASGLYGSGVDGYSENATGVAGTSLNGPGIRGTSFADTGIIGSSTNVQGVYGSSTYGTGVEGDSSQGNGVSGSAFGGGGSGVYGEDSSSGTDGYGVYGYSADGTALYSDGKAVVSGSLSVSGSVSKGGGSFKIDHPLDPANRYLYHSFVESPDMMNVYNGTVVLDRAGRAEVDLPEWFEALNRDFRYQLTALDRPAPDLHISRRVTARAFGIAGGHAGQEVSWQVTGIRQDAWANANRILVEVDKPAEDRGRYLHPDVIGDGAARPVVAMAAGRPRDRPSRDGRADHPAGRRRLSR